MFRKSNITFLVLASIISLTIQLNGQSLSYSGTNSFNITAPTHLNENLILSLERSPTGMTYGDNGNKFYLVGTNGDIVIQYALGTAYDFSTRGAPESFFRVNAQETSPQDVEFNDDGTRMYILGQTGDDVTEYSLSTAWDVSTATFTDVFDARTAIENLLGATNGDLLTGMSFNDDGSKLYIADRRSDDVFEFDLSTNYDVSTAGAVINNIPITGENNVRDISFNNDGTEIYVIGNSGDDVNTFPLTIPYDLSSVGVPSNNALPSSPDGSPQAILISNDGFTFYVAGNTDDEVKEYSLFVAFDFSSTISLVTTSPFPTIEIAPRGMTFNDDGTKLFVAGDQLNIVSEIALSTPYDISTGSLNAGLFVNNEESNLRGLAFNNTGTTLYIIGSNGDEINGYDLSSAYDLSSTITTTAGSPFNISSEDDNPSDIYFNNDGTKLYVLGNTGNDLNQYSLSPAYDLTDAIAANLDIAFPLNNGAGLVIDPAPLGMAFNSDGSKLYIAGNTGNDINEITLSNNFDLSSGTITNTNTYNINAQEATITDVAFNADGSKFFIVGTNGDDMNQYQTKGNLPEASINNGSIDNTTPLVITLTGDTFVDLGSGELTDAQVTIGNLPSELTGLFTLSGGNTIATLTLSGNVVAHLSSNDVDNLTFTFTDAAFTSSNAADIALAVGHTNVMGIDFIDCPQDIVYDGSWTGGNNAGVPDDSATDLAKGISVQADVTITANTNCDCLNVASGQTLTIADGVRLTVTNALELIGDIVLLGEAQLIQTHTSSKNIPGTGTLSVDQTGVLTNVYQTGFWGSPVTTNGDTYSISGVMKDGTTSTPQDITFTDASVLDGDGSTVPITVSGRWLASHTNDTNYTVPISAATVFTPGEGYSMKSTGGIDGSSTQNYTFVGIPNDGDYTQVIDDERLSMLGNPYPTELDANDFITDNTAAIAGTLYFYESGTEMDHFVGSYNGGYATYNIGVGGTPFNGGKTPDRYIAIGQGFFVNRDVANLAGSGGVGTSADIVFSNSQRAPQGDGGTSIFFSGANQTADASINENHVLRIGFDFMVDADKDFHRQIAIGFNGNTEEFESGYDSPMFDLQPSDLSLKVINYPNPCVITGVEYFNIDLEIPLQVLLDETREVTFSIDQTTLQTQNIFLKDGFTGDYFDLKVAPKSLELAPGTYNDRFSIVFKLPSNLSNDDIILKNLIKAYHNSTTQEIIVHSSQTNISRVGIYTILGQQLMDYKNTSNDDEIRLKASSLSKGIYIVNITSEKGKLTKKIVIE
ncbi:MAG: beta-propeller fold lactonase family protein [Flavobacteriaceae bacterium]